MNEKLPYILSGLLCLNDPDDVFTIKNGDVLKTVTYREATVALGKLINVLTTPEVIHG